MKCTQLIVVAASISLLTACGSKEGSGHSGSGTAAGLTAPASPGGDGTSRESARSLQVGSTVTGKLPCEPGKQSVWFRVVPKPVAGMLKLELRTPKDGDQSCVHLSAFDASGKLLDTVASPCSDVVKAFAVGEGPIRENASFLELTSSMGTCFASDYKITLSK
ncbi:MAG: hypothetical protein IPK82_36180 [Polyangiaceae bacterium]|nr:hypothetical protein [Polyangiaceae bacterium]